MWAMHEEDVKDDGFRVFACDEAKGGACINAFKTAVLFIEYQNEVRTLPEVPVPGTQRGTRCVFEWGRSIMLW